MAVDNDTCIYLEVICGLINNKLNIGKEERFEVTRYFVKAFVILNGYQGFVVFMPLETH